MVQRIVICLLLPVLAGCEPTAKTTNTQASNTPSFDSAIRVRVVPVLETSIGASGGVTGIVAAFRKATVAAEVGGRVMRRAVEPGDSVAKNDLLVALDRERAQLNVLNAQARLNSQRVNLAHTEHEFKRARELIAKEVISQDVVDDLRFDRERAAADLAAADSALAIAKRNLRDAQVVAPFAGTAEVIYVQEGDYLTPGTPVALITDFSRARLRAGVTAADAALIQPGQTANLAFEALGGANIEGNIHSVSRIKDPANGTYAVEIWLHGAAAASLREGMVAMVQLPYAQEGAKLAVPKSAVFRKNGSLFVYTVVDAKAIARPVRIGRSDGDVVQVLEGVSMHDTVVVDGLFALRDGALVVTELSAP